MYATHGVEIKTCSLQTAVNNVCIHVRHLHLTLTCTFSDLLSSILEYMVRTRFHVYLRQKLKRIY